MPATTGRVSLALVGAAAIVTTLAVGSSAQQSDPLLGVWKLNLAKSKYDPGPAPKAVTLKYEAAGQGMTVRVDGETPTGPMHWEYTMRWSRGVHASRRIGRGGRPRPPVDE